MRSDSQPARRGISQNQERETRTYLHIELARQLIFSGIFLPEVGIPRVALRLRPCFNPLHRPDGRVSERNSILPFCPGLGSCIDRISFFPLLPPETLHSPRRCSKRYGGSGKRLFLWQ